jgi:hypothetical protein
VSHVLESIIATNVTRDGEMVEVECQSGKLVTTATKRNNYSRNVTHSSNDLQENSRGTLPILFQETKGELANTLKNFVKSVLNLEDHVHERDDFTNHMQGRRNFSEEVKELDNFKDFD